MYLVEDIASWKGEEITDELLFPEKQSRQCFVDPLIVFPYEKDFIVSGKNNKLPFRDYIEKVWTHATYVLQEASEIWIIGYSFEPTDCMSLIERVRQAGKCKCIVIQNLPAECDRISALLKTDYRIQIPIETKPVPF